MQQRGSSGRVNQHQHEFTITAHGQGGFAPPAHQQPQKKKHKANKQRGCAVKGPNAKINILEIVLPIVPAMSQA